MNDMVCSCSSGYYGDGFVCTPCKTCAGNAIRSGSPCVIGSTADTVICTSNAGHYGDGTVCTVSGPATSATAILIMLVYLPMTLVEFKTDENNYIMSVANAASVTTSSVEILNVTAVSTRRMYVATERSLMSISVQVETSITSKTENAIMINQGTLNTNLNQKGMPSGYLTIISNVSATNSPPAQEISQASNEASSSLSTGIIAAIAIGSLLVTVTAIWFGAYSLRVKARMEAQKELEGKELEAEKALVGGELGFLGAKVAIYLLDAR